MSAEPDYLPGERKEIEKTIDFLEVLLDKELLSPYASPWLRTYA